MRFEFCEMANNTPTFISKIITGNKIWVYGYDTETKQVSLQWTSLQSTRPKRTQQPQRAIKCMLIIFLCWGIIHQEFVPPCTTVNSDFYCKTLRHLREVCQKRPKLWLNHNHHNNMPAHTSLKVMEY